MINFGFSIVTFGPHKKFGFREERYAEFYQTDFHFPWANTHADVARLHSLFNRLFIIYWIVMLEFNVICVITGHFAFLIISREVKFTFPMPILITEYHLFIYTFSVSFFSCILLFVVCLNQSSSFDIKKKHSIHTNKPYFTVRWCLIKMRNQIFSTWMSASH